MSNGRQELDRRAFLALGSAALAAATTTDARAEGQTAGLFAAPALENVRIGFVGIGLQGGGHVNNFLKIPGCRIVAVCDIREERTASATQAITAAGHPAPTAYTRGPRDSRSSSRRRRSFGCICRPTST